MSFESDLNAYSPDGRVYQIEYAMQSATHGTTVFSFKCNNTVVVMSEKKVLSSLHIPTNKHIKIYDHIVFSYSGIASDAKVIAKKSREYCLEHERYFNEKPSIEGLMQYLCKLALQFSEKDFSKKIFNRPFGSTIVCCGFDDQACLYVLDPSGSYRSYDIKSVGGGSEAVEEELQGLKEFDSVEEGIKKGFTILKKVMKDKISADNVEMAVVNKNGVCITDKSDIQKYLEMIV